MRRLSDVPIPLEPLSPYPIIVRNTKVIAGFGRGSSAIGVPTANVPIVDIPEKEKLTTGVYFGFVLLHHPHVISGERKFEPRIDGKSTVEVNYGERLSKGQDSEVVLPMVMSIGSNPYFKNDRLTAELHIMHQFKHSFYGASLSFNILGYIRPELDYTTLEALIQDINIDIEIALTTLAKPGYVAYKKQLLDLVSRGNE